MTQQKESTVKRFFKNPEIIINTSLYGVAIYFAIMGMISKSINQLLQAIFVALTTIAITQLFSSYTSFRMNLKESETFDKITERIKALERIESGLTKLIEKKHCKFFADISLTWNKAIEMVGKVRPGGFIYDSTSIKNRDIYEEAIKQKCKEVEITRVICTNDFQKESIDFIHSECFSAPNISISHLPYSTPFDVLITRDGNNIEAIIGIRTSKNDENYTSALYIFDKEFARQILSVYQNILLHDVHQPKGEIESGNDISCNICKEIELSKANRNLEK